MEPLNGTKCVTTLATSNKASADVAQHRTRTHLWFQQQLMFILMNMNICFMITCGDVVLYSFDRYPRVFDSVSLLVFHDAFDPAMGLRSTRRVAYKE